MIVYFFRHPGFIQMMANLKKKVLVRTIVIQKLAKNCKNLTCQRNLMPYIVLSCCENVLENYFHHKNSDNFPPSKKKMDIIICPLCKYNPQYSLTSSQHFFPLQASNQRSGFIFVVNLNQFFFCTRIITESKWNAAKRTLGWITVPLSA